MTPEQIEQERTAFEAWYRRWAGEEPSVLVDIEGELQYKSTADHQLFSAWQARAAQSEWISVEDEYPEDGQEVNILLNTGEVRIALHELGTPGGGFTKGHYFTGNIYHIYGAEYNCSVYGDDVTHWQPLPQPPKGDPA